MRASRRRRWAAAGGIGVDSLESDVLELKPAVAAAPSARWLSPEEGQTVSGVLSESGIGAQRCEAKVTGPVVRTENYVDGQLNDTQLFAPWACEWDTRNYVNGGHLAHGQGVRRGRQRDRRRHREGDRRQPQPAAG